MLNPDSPLAKLLNTMPQIGIVEWIGIRPQHRASLLPLHQVEITKTGLKGDHYKGGNGKRAVTLIQAEHLNAIASIMGANAINPMLLRRNIVVRGINLLALKDQRFQIGDAILGYTGLCHPCSRMEEALGTGGYNAMRGHGGITARLIDTGAVQVGAAVQIIT